jgi:hypothetical protein
MSRVSSYAHAWNGVGQYYLVVHQNQSPLHSVTKLLLIVIFEARESGRLVAIHPLKEPDVELEDRIFPRPLTPI